MATVYVYSGGSNTSPFDNWTKAATTLTSALGVAVAGDTIVIAQDHNESAVGASTTWTFPGTLTNPCYIICVDRAVASGWGAADVKVMTNQIATTGNGFTMSISGPSNGCNHFEGIKFQTGTSTNAASLFIAGGTVAQDFYFRNCSFTLAGSGSSQNIQFGSSTNSAVTCLMENCSFAFGNVANSIVIATGKIRFAGGSIAATGTIPTTLFSFLNTHRPYGLEFEGVDLSAFSTGKTLIGAASNVSSNVLFKDCRLNATLPTISAEQTVPGNEVIMTRSGSAATNYVLQKYGLNGNQTHTTTVRRNGGAAGPDSQGIAWQFTTGTAAKRYAPFVSIPIAAWNSTTGSSVTATIHGIYDAAAVPTAADIWAEFYYLGNASYPLSSLTKDGNAASNFFASTATSHTADTSDWDDGATARANSTAYSVGDVIKLGTNAGRLFFCTSGGTSNGSEPAGYAAAVDGGSVTDSGATFRAGCRFKLSASFTPNIAGAVYARIYVAKASVARLFIDPKIVLS